MPSTFPSQVLRFTASASVIAHLAAHSPAAAPQKPTTPTPSSQAKLDRVKDLEARLIEAEKKTALASMEKNYITRTQKQYEAYYQSAFTLTAAAYSRNLRAGDPPAVSARTTEKPSTLRNAVRAPRRPARPTQTVRTPHLWARFTDSPHLIT